MGMTKRWLLDQGLAFLRYRRSELVPLRWCGRGMANPYLDWVPVRLERSLKPASAIRDNIEEAQDRIGRRGGVRPTIQ